jgi:hypothetical protein
VSRLLITWLLLAGLVVAVKGLVVALEVLEQVLD